MRNKKSNQTLFNGFYMLLQPFTCLSRHTYAVISSIWTGISEQPMSGNCNMWPFWVESWETLHSGNMICAAIQHNYFLGPACRLQNPMEDRRTRLRRTMATGWSFWLWVKRCLSESTLGKWFLEFNFQFKPFNCNSMVTTIQWSLGPCGLDALTSSTSSSADEGSILIHSWIEDWLIESTWFNFSFSQVSLGEGDVATKMKPKVKFQFPWLNSKFVLSSLILAQANQPPQSATAFCAMANGDLWRRFFTLMEWLRVGGHRERLNLSFSQQFLG